MSSEPVARRGPKPQPANYRGIVTTVRLTSFERQQIKTYAERESVTFSEAIREALLNLLSDADDGQ